VDPPIWFPRSRIWVDRDLLGDGGVAGALLERIRAVGAVVREETAIENAARLERELQASRERQRLRDSQSGVAAGNAAYVKFSSELRRIAEMLGFTIHERRHSSPLTFVHHGHCLQHAWRVPYSNSLQEAVLTVAYHNQL
jgi:hypothetical protein